MWVKAHKIDDWGTIAYVLGDVVTHAAGTISLQTQKPERILKPGNYRVRFNDGTERAVTVQEEAHFETVSDMGHEDTVRSMVPYFVVPLFGSEIRMRPQDVEWYVDD